jgi:glycine/D-amino acid oxidase-like deaminating enzyme
LIYDSTPEVGAFELRNYEAIRSLIATHNIPCEWKSIPGCHAFMSSSMFETAVKGVETLKKTDPELGKLVSVITKESTNPSLEDLRVPRAAGAILQVHAASLWPYKFVSWILESLIASSFLNLQTNTPVTNLQKMDKGWIIHTPRGMLSAPTVLLTTNAYTSHLLPAFSDLIVPVRGEMSALLPPKSVTPLSSTMHKPLECSYGFLGHGKQSTDQDDYLIQRPFTHDGKSGGQLMFGGARSYAENAGIGVSDDSAIDPPAAAYLRREINVLLELENEGKELQASWEWSGIMGYSRDGHPWVGQVSPELGVGGGEGLWLSGGFTGHGMPNAWLCGKAVAQLILGREMADVDVPEGYKLSKERIERVRTHKAVWLAESEA